VEDVELLPTVAEAIKLFNESDLKVLVVTNQSGIARGYFDKETLIQIHRKMEDELAKYGAHVDAIYYCPHHPDEDCICRKPKTALFYRAAMELDIDFIRSFVIGDTQMDIDAGKALGCQTVLITTGLQGGNEITGPPDYTADSLLEAAQWVMKRCAMKKISIVIPALNEEEAITGTIQAIPKDKLEAMGYEAQILVVDNGSNDRTGELASQAGAEVVFEPERGYGRAYKTGFAHARGDIIATADADLTYPVEDIPKLVQTLEQENLDFITTNRYAYMRDGAMSPMHRVGNAILNLTTRLLFGADIRDSQSGMWVFKRSLLHNMKLRYDTMALSEELKLEACYFIKSNWKEVPIEYRARVGEVKLRSWRDGLGNLFRLIKKRVMR